MNFQFYLEKLFASEDFQKFKEENKDSYPCSCFFVIDKEKNDNKQHFDYFVPSTKKMFSFKIESRCERVPVEQINEKSPEKISNNYDFDFKNIEKSILDKMEKENIKSGIQKILLSLQNSEGKECLLGTVFISALGMIKIKINLEDMNIEEFEKKSFIDMFKIHKKK